GFLPGLSRLGDQLNRIAPAEGAVMAGPDQGAAEVVAGDLLARQLLRPGNRGQQRQAACQGTNIATKRREDRGQAAELRRIIDPARSRANAGYVSIASVAYQRSRAAASALALARVCSSGASRSRRRCTR